jgi:alpha-N-arabinofuranosidase
MISEQCCSEFDGAPEGLIKNLVGDIRECTLAYRDLMQTVTEFGDTGIQLAIDRWCYAFERELCPEEAGGLLIWAHGLGIAAGVHQFIRDSDVLGLAAYALAIGNLGAVCVSNDGVCLTAAGQVLSLYRNHFGTEAVAVKDDCEPLDVVAAWTGDRTALTFGIVNPLDEEADVEVALKGGERLAPETSWVITASDLSAANLPGREEAVILEERPVNGNEGNLVCPPLSAGIYRQRVE